MQGTRKGRRGERDIRNGSLTTYAVSSLLMSTGVHYNGFDFSKSRDRKTSFGARKVGATRGRGKESVEAASKREGSQRLRADFWSSSSDWKERG